MGTGPQDRLAASWEKLKRYQSRMALSPDQSLLYRTPPPKDSINTSPRATPKRKRIDPTESDSAQLRIDTEIDPEHFHPSVPSLNSPRTKVAENLRELNLRQVQPATRRTGDKHMRHKRLKRTPDVVENSASDDLYVVDRPRIQLGDSTRENGDVAINEVGETPDCRTRTRLSPSDPSSRLGLFEEIQESPIAFEQDGDLAVQSPPSPQVLVSSPPSVKLDVVDRSMSLSPLPLQEELSPDQAALTWQDDEITGHEIDPSGEDDGEGINGIGFQPTNAIAARRQQRRKQQVNEWKAREAREARQKRIECRRGAPDETAESVQEADATARRMVRFVGVG